jgi:ribonuclease D
MTSQPLPAPILITQATSLRRAAETLSRAPLLAVDTESNSLYAYQERVCLIQFSIPGADYLVDPLALRDLSPLAPLFRDPDIEKIFHAAEYDLMCLNRDFGFEFENLFDTMLAARILGREAIGLGSMLKAEFGVSLNKRYQRANWGQRPLPPHLLDYARLDTHYLIPLRERLKAALEAKGMWPLASEDFRRLSIIRFEGVNANPGEAEEVNPWRVSGAYDLEPQQAAVLMEVCRYREGKARSMDRPLFKVIGDKTLLAIAAESPASLEQLGRIKGMSAGQVRRHGRSLLKAVRRGMGSKPLYPPRQPRPDEGYMARLEALRDWRKYTARRMGVKSDVVLPRDLLERLAAQNPCDPGTLARALHDVPWRLERFGDQILAVLKEKL